MPGVATTIFFGRPGPRFAGALAADFFAAVFVLAAFFVVAALAADFLGRPGPRFGVALLLPEAFFGAALRVAAFFGAAALAADFFGRPGPRLAPAAFAIDFVADFFATGFFAADFLAVGFFAAAFLAGVFFAAAAFAGAFLLAAFFPAGFFPAGFFPAGFFAVLRAPAFIASAWADGQSIVVSSVLTRVYSSSGWDRFQTGSTGQPGATGSLSRNTLRCCRTLYGMHHVQCARGHGPFDRPSVIVRAYAPRFENRFAYSELRYSASSRVVSIKSRAHTA